MTEPGPGELPPHPAQEPPAAVTAGRQRDDERAWAVIAHLGGFVLAVVIAWIIRGTVGRRSEFVRDQATEAMNFQLTALVAFLVSVVLWVIVIGLLLTVVVGVGALILSVLAALAAHAGIRYRYPVCVRLIH